MRILYIHQYFATPGSATGTRSYEFSRYLLGQGHEVTMLTGPTWLDEVSRRGLVTRAVIDGIRVVMVGVPYFPRMGFVRRVWSFLAFMLVASWVARRVPCDVVYASSTPLTVGIPGWLAARRRHVPFIFEVRDLWPEAPIQLGVLRNPLLCALARWLEKFLYRRAAHVVALSPGMADGVVARGVGRERVSVIPNASDTHLFRPNPKDSEVLARWGLADDEFVVGYVGAMGPSNGLDQVIQAARIVGEAEAPPRPPTPQRRTVFLMVGDGPQRFSLRRRAAELGLDNVVWADPVPKAEVPRLLDAVDVVLASFAPVPVLETNSPNKAFDAMAAGKPLVVNFGGWIADLVREHGIGRAAAPGDAASLADALMELRDDPQERARMGAAARRLAKEHFDRTKLAAKLESLLSRVASSPA